MYSLDGMASGRLGSLRQWVRDGGYAADPGAFGANFGEAPSEFTNLEGFGGDILNALAEIPGAPGMIGKGMRVGIKGANAHLLDTDLKKAGFGDGLSFGQQISAAFGFNSYGGGGPKAMAAANVALQRSASRGETPFRSVSASGGVYRTSPSGPTNRLGGGAGEGSGGAGARDNDRSTDARDHQGWG